MGSARLYVPTKPAIAPRNGSLVPKSLAILTENRSSDMDKDRAKSKNPKPPKSPPNEDAPKVEGFVH